MTPMAQGNRCRPVSGRIMTLKILADRFGIGEHQAVWGGRCGREYSERCERKDRDKSDRFAEPSRYHDH